MATSQSLYKCNFLEPVINNIFSNFNLVEWVGIDGQQLLRVNEVQIIV